MQYGKRGTIILEDMVSFGLTYMSRIADEGSEDDE